MPRVGRSRHMRTSGRLSQRYVLVFQDYLGDGGVVRWNDAATSLETASANEVLQEDTATHDDVLAYDDPLTLPHTPQRDHHSAYQHGPQGAWTLNVPDGTWTIRYDQNVWWSTPRIATRGWCPTSRATGSGATPQRSPSTTRVDQPQPVPTEAVHLALPRSDSCGSTPSRPTACRASCSPRRTEPGVGCPSAHSGSPRSGGCRRNELHHHAVREAGPGAVGR